LAAAHYHVLKYGSAQQFLNQLSDEPGLGCVLLSTPEPGLVGPQLHAELKNRHSTLPIIFLTGFANVLKNSPKSKFTNLLRRIDRAIFAREQVLTLTPTDKKLLRRFAHGDTDKEIAGQLGAKENIIADRRHRIMEALHAGSNAELAAMASQLPSGQAKISGWLYPFRGRHPDPPAATPAWALGTRGQPGAGPVQLISQARNRLRNRRLSGVVASGL
jgi:FixJ family two-component response regulator